MTEKQSKELDLFPELYEARLKRTYKSMIRSNYSLDMCILAETYTHFRKQGFLPLLETKRSSRVELSETIRIDIYDTKGEYTYFVPKALLIFRKKQ